MYGTISLYTEALKVVTGLFFFTLISSQLVLCTKHGNVSPKTCTNAGTFRVSFGQSFEACIEECQRRKRCEIVMYKHGINECCLKDFINVAGLKEEAPICLFTNINTRKRTGLDPCDKNSCGLTEICVTSSTDPNRFECVKSECPTPPKIFNATVLSNMHELGYKNAYKCDLAHISNGEPFITCNKDGTWTSTKFICDGGKETSDYVIADLISIVGDEWLEGTRVNFACRNGYQGLGTDASSVLNSKAEWEPSVLECCNENITEFVWGNTCIATFNGSLATTFEDMWSFCKDKGGGLKGFGQSLADFVFETEGYLLLMDGTLKETYRWYLQQCFIFHNVSKVLDNFSNYTYVELVGEVVSRDLKGHWYCDTARRWGQNEPDGGEAEECVVYMNGTDGIHDVDCSVYTGRPDIGFICHFLLPIIQNNP